MLQLRLELKICEHCGVLWLRQIAARTVFCARCEEMLARQAEQMAKPV